MKKNSLFHSNQQNKDCVRCPPFGISSNMPLVIDISNKDDENKKNTKNEACKCDEDAIQEKIEDKIKKIIKDELEKNLKCKIDDNTKDEIADEIMDKIEEEKIRKEVGNKEENQVQDNLINIIKDNVDKEQLLPEDNNIITAKVITSEHATTSKCGNYARYYKSSPENQVGRYAFNTSEILWKLYPEMFNNPEIMKHIKPDANIPYSAHNFKFIFSDDINYAWGSPSNMWCKSCKQRSNDLACKDYIDTKSFCYSAKSSSDNKEYSKNFFNTECPNLISNFVKEKSEEQVIAVKQAIPMLIVNYGTGKIISRDGQETDQYYSICEVHLDKDSGRPKSIEDCDNDQCKDCINVLNESLWDAGDKTIMLKIPEFNSQASTPNAAPIIYESENDNTPYYVNNDLI